MWSASDRLWVAETPIFGAADSQCPLLNTAWRRL
jgi:hypothetical protein